jgi:hypothetical protein
MGRTTACLLLLALSFAPLPAADHSNLDDGRPARVEDAYAVSQGELSIEVGPQFISRRSQNERAAFDLELTYGLAPNLHVGMETGRFTDPGGEEGGSFERSGDVGVSALYNLNQETRSMPALGFKVKANLPTGIDSRGMDAEAKLLVTRSIRRLSLHANAVYRKMDGTAPGERESRFEHVLGASYPLGAPLHTRTLLVADLFVEQAGRHDERNTAGAEAGIRHQLTQRVVIDAGLGSELRGPEDRNTFTATAGVSVSF